MDSCHGALLSRSFTIPDNVEEKTVNHYVQHTIASKYHMITSYHIILSFSLVNMIIIVSFTISFDAGKDYHLAVHHDVLILH